MAPRNRTSPKGAPAPKNQSAAVAPDASECIEFPLSALEITSVPPHFWRAGRKFTQAPTVIPLADLDDEDQGLLRNEPMLRVRDIEVTQDDIDIEATLAEGSE